MVKTLVCIPSYDGKIHIKAMKGLIEAINLSYQRDLVVDVLELSGISLIQHARNAVATKFLDTDYDNLFFLDTDIGFRGEQMHLLISQIQFKDIVGAVYPMKQSTPTFAAYPALDGENTIEQDKDGLIEMDFMPLGFSIINRHVLESLAPLVKTYVVGDVLCREFFRVYVSNGNLIGEDVHFCNLAKKHGFSVWADPYIKLEHVGEFSYSASFNDALINNNLLYDNAP